MLYMGTLLAFLNCAWGPTPKHKTGLRPVATFAAILLASNLHAASTSPLADAAEKLDRAAIQALIKDHADVNAAQVDGMTALHWAVHHEDREMAALLVRAGASVQAANRYG